MPDFLPYRNAFADKADVETEELFVGSDHTPPRLSIMIPTFQRHDLLIDALRSALAQNAAIPIEMVVLDDDPQSSEIESLLADVPELARANFRYLRNRQNLGYYQNHSRCIEVARGAWLTILHDDDMLDPGFAREMLAQFDRDPRIKGLTCRKRTLDCRAVPYTESWIRGIPRQLMELLQFGFKNTRVIGGRKLFWSCMLGNMAGFMCRTADARRIGGFYPEEYPSADYYFYARFAHRLTLGEMRKTLMTFRVFVNAAIKKETNVAALRKNFELQSACVGTVVPKSWGRIIPLLMARQVKTTGRYWGNDVTNEEIGADLGVKLPRDRPYLLYTLRTLLGGL
ncbi:glycosyltransferase family 2 protein [Sphingomonas sp.]|uniref:glycosyltransferase family 2 protein n=1 Tax=Sphingomonas sp. TaxID=28214 RepID=UPI0035BBB58F